MTRLKTSRSASSRDATLYEINLKMVKLQVRALVNKAETSSEPRDLQQISSLVRSAQRSLTAYLAGGTKSAKAMRADIVS